MSVETKNLYTSGSNTQIHPNIVTDGLVFYIDPFNFKSRDRSFNPSGGTINDISKDIRMSGTLTNGITISDDYKSIDVDGTDDYIIFPNANVTSNQPFQPFQRYKPSTYTLSYWVKSGSTGGGVMFFVGIQDYKLELPALTATTYTPGVYTNVPTENISDPLDTTLNFTITVNGSGVITDALAENVGTNSDNGEIMKILGSDIGGSSPADDAYFTFRVASSSDGRWGISQSNNYSAYISNSDNRTSFNLPRVGNEPNEWNLITYTDEGQLLTEGNRKFYVNGELMKSSTSGDTTFLNGSWMDNPNTGILYIGRDGTTFANTLNGEVGTCMMYERALTQKEVQKNYYSLKKRFNI